MYLSGEDNISKGFETEILTKDGIIMIMVNYSVMIDNRMSALKVSVWMLIQMKVWK